MTSQRPGDYPEWATDASADVSTPPTAKQELGWVVEKPSHHWINWLFKFIYLWVAYFDVMLTPLRSPTVALEALGDDEPIMLVPPEGVIPFEKISAFAYATTVGIFDIATDGGYVYLVESANNCVVLEHDAITGALSLVRTIPTGLTLTSAARVVTDGVTIVVAQGSDVVGFNASDGSSKWTTTVSGSAIAMWCDGRQHVYVLNYDTTSTVRALALADGVLESEASLTGVGTFHDLTGSQRHIFVAYETGGPSLDIEVIDVSDPTDINAGVVGSYILINATIPADAYLAAQGSYLATCHGQGSWNEALISKPFAELATVSPVSGPDTYTLAVGARGIAIDDRYVYVAFRDGSSNDWVRVISKVTKEVLRDISLGNISASPRMATSGMWLYVSVATAGASANRLYAIWTGQGPSWYYRRKEGQPIERAQLLGAMNQRVG